MPSGLDQLQHIVVLMMENRPFDHMLGALKPSDPRIDGIDGNQTNPDTDDNDVAVSADAAFRGQLTPDPDHVFIAVDKQIFNGDPNRVANMKGFVRSYWDQLHDIPHSHNVMKYFGPGKLKVLTKLATEFAVFNAWFASIPGPTLCNRAFAHYGTSFGQVGMKWWYVGQPIDSVYARLVKKGYSAKVYYYDSKSSTLEVPNLLKDQPDVFGTYPDFLAACASGTLPNYSFIEPNYSDHDADDGTEVLASDQHPDHDVREGERFIASIYNAIRRSKTLWPTTALLVVYDEHGGLFDHVVPPPCTPDDGFPVNMDETGGIDFKFDRLGVRVPAILVSPWVPRNTVVPKERIFEHASIPNTVMTHFGIDYPDGTAREKAAATFLDLLSLDDIRTDGFLFSDK
jgi:phospholipase C